MDNGAGVGLGWVLEWWEAMMIDPPTGAARITLP
jgi:hypothetical protein